MKSIIIILLLTAVTSFAQIFQPFPKGLSVEVSANYPSLLWDINSEGPTNADRTNFWITPAIKINYEVTLYKNITTKPFVGYFSFGGRSDDYPDGYKDRYVINAIEAGTFLLYNVKDFEFGLGAKWNRHLSYKNHYYGSLGPGNSEREWRQTDVDFFFKKYSFDWGIRVSYLAAYKINIFAELWKNLHNIANDNISDLIDIKANTIKLGAGYNF